MKHLIGVVFAAFMIALISMPIVGGSRSTEGDLSGTWSGSFEANGRWDYTMTLRKESTDKYNGTIIWTYAGKKLDPPDDVTIEVSGAGKLHMTWRKDTVDGTFSKDKMVVSGVNGPMTFTRKN